MPHTHRCSRRQTAAPCTRTVQCPTRCSPNSRMPPRLRPRRPCRPLLQPTQLLHRQRPGRTTSRLRWVRVPRLHCRRLRLHRRLLRLHHRREAVLRMAGVERHLSLSGSGACHLQQPVGRRQYPPWTRRTCSVHCFQWSSWRAVPHPRLHPHRHSVIAPPSPAPPQTPPRHLLKRLCQTQSPPQCHRRRQLLPLLQLLSPMHLPPQPPQPQPYLLRTQ
mmetsp:Transcript_7631/g.22564  ORF Transcript_7631/g.22564 Transcript_7631/m.22564 type:complete len:218 (-) Transcript_7631:770-1423(-)